MKGSSTLIAAQMANEMGAAGVDVIDLSVGEPDFDTPDFIKRYAVEGLEKGLTKYTATAGTVEFRKAIVDFYAARFNAGLSQNEIAASCGGKQASMFNAACTLLDPGDDVLIPKPYWVTFPEIVTFCRANSVFIETEQTEFILTAEQVEAAITPKTRLLIINSPSNPSGRVVPPGEMRKIVEVCASRNVFLPQTCVERTAVLGMAHGVIGVGAGEGTKQSKKNERRTECVHAGSHRRVNIELG